ncbi:MAG: phosphoglucosamine mutase, partial [Xanthomonadales bacterium]|nr:phosphoglucosamine mutase [Xanthomonadales bacterium]
TTGDGIVSALMVLSVMIKEGKNLKELADEIPLYPQVLINITVENAKSLAQHQDVISLSTEIDKELGNNGRTLIRASGTQPMLRVMVEAKDEKLAEKYAGELVSLVNNL